MKIDDYRQFLGEYPQSANAQAARDAIDWLEFDAASRVGTKAALETYVAAHPESDLAGRAREQLFVLRDEEAWNSACRTNSQSGYEDYLREFPEGRFASNARSGVVAFRLPAALEKYVARKGSVCIDGVSLTVNQAEGDVFEVNLIPHTLQVTTLGRLAPGARVNVEVDLIARYVERMLA